MAACDSVPTTCPLTPVMIASTEWGIVAHHQDFYKALFMIKKKNDNNLKFSAKKKKILCPGTQLT